MNNELVTLEAKQSVRLELIKALDLELSSKPHSEAVASTLKAEIDILIGRHLDTAVEIEELRRKVNQPSLLKRIFKK